MKWDAPGLGAEVAYPCRWEYTVIARSASAAKAAIAAVFAGLEHTVRSSHQSRTGKYCSLIVAAEVRDESHRNQLFVALKQCADVVFVL